MPANEAVELYFLGDRFTARASAAVTGKRFVAISGNRQNQANASMHQVAPVAAGAKAIGVAVKDAAQGEPVGVLRMTVVPVTAGANLTAGTEVEADSQGRAIPLASGRSCGYVLNGAASGADAEILVH